MSALYCHTVGQGDRDLVMLHGWGLNAEVWHCVTEPLGSHFRLHLIDLPGFGRSQHFPPCNLAQMADAVAAVVPQGALLLGWSLGGLVASELARRDPQRYAGLITVASSPCFTAAESWPGIKPDTLEGFRQQLSHDFQRTVERFLALQTLGTERARQDARVLKQVVLSQPMPSVAVLEAGLEILQQSDLRPALADLPLPFLRIYGYLDGLVPRRVAALLDEAWPQSRSVVMEKAAHAPFISHPAAFCQQVVEFSQVRQTAGH